MLSPAASPLNQTIIWKRYHQLIVHTAAWISASLAPFSLLYCCFYTARAEETSRELMREQPNSIWYNDTAEMALYVCSTLWASQAPCCVTVASVEASNEMCFYCYSVSLSLSLMHRATYSTVRIHVYFTMRSPFRSRNVPTRMFLFTSKRGSCLESFIF